MIVRKQRAQIVAVLAFLAILLSPLLTAMTVEAETYIVIYDQEDNIVTSKVEFVGAKHYNETHAIVVVVIAFSLFLLKRRGGTARATRWEALDENEAKAIEVLRAKGGRALEVEISEALGLPKTTAWRLVRRLERKGLVVVRKVGNQNVVELRVSS